MCARYGGNKGLAAKPPRSKTPDVTGPKCVVTSVKPCRNYAVNGGERIQGGNPFNVAIAELRGGTDGPNLLSIPRRVWCGSSQLVRFRRRHCRATAIRIRGRDQR